MDAEKMIKIDENARVCAKTQERKRNKHMNIRSVVSQLQEDVI